MKKRSKMKTILIVIAIIAALFAGVVLFAENELFAGCAKTSSFVLQ